MIDLFVKKIVNKYLDLFPGEKESLKILCNQIDESGEKGILSRSTTPGHITASAVVLSQDFSKVLLINHVFLEKFIQPGGHVDSKDFDIMSAASRELKEEAGMSKIVSISIADDVNIPFDIDIQNIPENPKKQEPEHFHYDFRYLFFVYENENISEKLEEVHSAKWVDFEEFAQMEDFSELAKKMSVILEKRRKTKFDL